MNKVSLVAFTRSGCALARDLARHLADVGGYACEVARLATTGRLSSESGLEDYGRLDAWTGNRFADSDAIVFVGATGIAVRAIAPHVQDKFKDPAVVAVDEKGRFAVPLLSGHVGGANELARAVAKVTGGQAAISTATDVNGLFAVDEWAREQGLALVERDVARDVSASLLEGVPVGFASDFEIGGQLPAGFVEGDAELGVYVSVDASKCPFERTLHLVPRVASIGIGCKRGTSLECLSERVDGVLQDHGLSPLAVAELCSIDVKRDEPALVRLSAERDWPLRLYSAEELSRVEGTFSASEFVAKTVGVDNVCERAAVASGGQLVVAKQAGRGVTVAVALHDPALSFSIAEGAGGQKAGKLSIVGLGPGAERDLTLRARDALEQADLIVGYTVYVDLLKSAFPDKEMRSTPMRGEVQRCRMALEEAASGRRVALVCSGDPGVYGMAGLCYGLSRETPDVAIEVVAGVTAAMAGAAVLGAPLMHDFAVISLSDLLTPWESIADRLACAARSGFVICLYNPSSHKRAGYLRRACDIVLEHRDEKTVCGYVRNIGREGESSRICTLSELREAHVDMFTTVFIGNERTEVVAGHMVTPRGYLKRGV